MILGVDIDMMKAGQLKNVLMHVLANQSEAEANVTVQSQFGFKQSDNRIVVMTSNGLRDLAYTSDFNTTKTVYYQDTQPVLPSGELFDNGVLWYSAASSKLKMYSRNTQSWNTIGLNAPTGIPAIPLHSASSVYPDNACVVYTNRLYQNQTGGDVTGVWNPVKWTYIGDTVSEIPRALYSITSDQTDNSTIGSITRNGFTYTINHALNLSQAYVSCQKSSDGEFIEPTIKNVNSNVVSINFNDRKAQYDVSVAIM